MKLWHNTEDAPRVPEKVSEGKLVALWVVTYPIEPGQHIMVEWKVTHGNETTEDRHTNTKWQHNEFSLGKSYWLATIGPFRQGDRVDYVIRGMSGGGTLYPQMFVFIVE